MIRAQTPSSSYSPDKAGREYLPEIVENGDEFILDAIGAP